MSTQEHKLGTIPHRLGIRHHSRRELDGWVEDYRASVGPAGAMPKR